MSTRTNWYSDHPAACTCAFCNEKRTMQPEQGKIGRNAKCPATAARSTSAVTGNSKF